jgi:hypothetical protein
MAAMKKLIILAIVLLTASSVNAQVFNLFNRKNQDHANFYHLKYGIVGGLNVTNVVGVTDIPYFKTDTKIGTHIGTSIDIPILYPLALEVEVISSQRGYRAYTLYGNFTQNRGFVDVPLLFKLQATPNFSFLLGPQISFHTSISNDYKDGFRVDVEDIYDLKNKGYAKTIVDAVAGVNVNLTQNVELRLRYSADFKNYNGNNENLKVDIPQFRNQVWQMGFGVKLWK